MEASGLNRSIYRISDEPFSLFAFSSDTEFRLTIDPNGQPAKSPVVNCAPDLTRTPLRSAR